MPEGPFFGPLQEQIEKRGMRLVTIVEHRSDEEVPVVGTVEYEGDHGYHAFAVDWSHDRMNRTTIFSRTNWKLEVKNCRQQVIAFLIRTSPDEGQGDLPWTTANLYTLILVERRRT